MKLYLATITAVTLLTGTTSHARNWPQWRGPFGNGVAEKGEYPVAFSTSDNLLWTASLPGKGSSTPIVWEDNIVLTSGIGENNDGEDGALCFDWTGKELWRLELGKQVPGKHRRGSGSCPSPVTDGNRIFVYFKSGTLAALDFEGQLVWKTNLQKRYGEDTLWWDLGTSPVLADGKVVVAVLHEGNSYMVAFEQKTGKVAWKVDRNIPCPQESGQSYTTPILIREGDRETLVVWGADHLTGHDPATGKTTWQCGGFNPQNKKMWRTIASPAIAKDIVVVPYARGRQVAGIKVGGNGDITGSARIWEKKNTGTDASTPVVLDNEVYFFSLKGDAWCLDVNTGEENWKTSLPKGKGSIYSSPTLSGDKLYLSREDGDVFVCKVNRKGLNILNQAKFNDHFVATPVLVRGRVILRGDKNLYCIGKKVDARGKQNKH